MVSGGVHKVQNQQFPFLDFSKIPKLLFRELQFLFSQVGLVAVFSIFQVPHVKFSEVHLDFSKGCARAETFSSQKKILPPRFSKFRSYFFANYNFYFHKLVW